MPCNVSEAADVLIPKMSLGRKPRRAGGFLVWPQTSAPGDREPRPHHTFTAKHLYARLWN